MNGKYDPFKHKAFGQTIKHVSIQDTHSLTRDYNWMVFFMLVQSSREGKGEKQ